MKKFSKILACLLSLAILLSLNAFAADHVDFVLKRKSMKTIIMKYTL